MIEVLKQMVEALEWCHGGEPIGTAEAIKAGKKLIAELESQKPVATLENLEQEIYENTRNFVSLDVMEWMLKRYYTHPPQRTWVGLTKDEVDSWNLPDHPTVFEFAQFIEAKLKELNI